ncbi:MAG: type II secretion system F family protein, partial [Pseudobdellovibrionaceae bacterium]
MHQFRYRAINNKGRQVKGIVAAANESDLYAQLSAAGLELLSCAQVRERNQITVFKKKNVKTRDLIQLFMHLEQLQAADVPMLDSLVDIRDTTENNALRDIMSEVYRAVSEGSSLSEAMSQHPKVFSNLYVSLVKAGEDTGDLVFAYKQLLKFLNWVDELGAKIKKATRYPMILLAVVILTMIVMLGFVVPQVVGFIATMGTELPIYTKALMWTSGFFQVYWWTLIVGPLVVFLFYKLMRKGSEDFALRTDAIWLQIPVAGTLIRKITIARYSQTFAALFASGIPVLGCLKSAQNTVTNRAMKLALDNVQEAVKNGMPLSEAFNRSGEFPS